MWPPVRVGSLGRFTSTAALVAGCGLALGCAHGPDVAVSGLGLKRVVIYRNGVGYFERAGRVDAEQVTFKIRSEKVGDFLATLAVIEQGGSSVRSASFPVELEKKDDAAGDDDGEAADPRYEVLLKRRRRRRRATRRINSRRSSSPSTARSTTSSSATWLRRRSGVPPTAS